jgi:aromatic amino acid aminotransferase I / 2-aminoadipate transaminase
MPHPSVFPFADISANILLQDSFSTVPPSVPSSSSFSWLWRLFGSGSSDPKTSQIAIPKAPSEGDDGINLATALQYGPAVGMAALQKFIYNFSASVYKPARPDFATLVHSGNTDGWARIARLLCNSGDTINTEEWTYPSAIATTAPYAVKVLPIDMDGIGMRADSLRELLANWDESKGKR